MLQTADLRSMTTRITGGYIFTCCIAVLLSFLLHELMHWLAGEALGYEMALTLNSVYPVSGQYAQTLDYTIVSAAGPMFTLIQAVVSWLLLRVNDKPLFYPYLLTPLYMRVLAAVMSITNPNDEARIGKAFGLGTFTLPLIVCCVLLWMVIDVNQKRRWEAKFTWVTVALIIAFSTALILCDQFLKIRLL